MELSSITDIKIAEFTGIKETKTLRNWKKMEEGSSLYNGKQNLYKAAKLKTYLYSKSDANKQQEERNIDVLIKGAETLEKNLNIDTTNLEEGIVAAITESNLKAISNVKAILDDFRKIDETEIKVIVKNK